MTEDKIDRKKLGDIVFSSKEKMDILTGITWDYMQRRVDSILEKQNGNVILDWALLPISKYWNMCNTKILCISELNERKSRVMERDNISDDYFEKRESNSLDYNDLEFDYTLENNSSNEKMEILANVIMKNKM